MRPTREVIASFRRHLPQRSLLGQVAAFYQPTSRRAGVTLLALFFLSVALSASAALNPFLKTSGTQVRNDFGQGDIVPLRGVNLGGWLLLEPWMCPMDTSGNLPDDWSARETLTQRFGAAGKDNLIAAYQNAWLQESDFDRIAALGMNVVRLPFWYLNLQDEDGTWRADAFARLDWAVSNAWSRGIYTILDLHGVHGGQRANADTTGRLWPTAALWTAPAEQDRMVEIWRRVSEHFSGNPAIAGYDLLNEPMDTPSAAVYWNLLDRCYQVIRTNDPQRLIIMEATYGSWNLAMLPAPAARGWSNVVYQLHNYPWDTWNDTTQLNANTDGVIQDWFNHAAWNVPCHVGEFNMGPEAAWKYAIERYSTNGLGWQMWTYKSTYTGGTTSWGVYNPSGGATTPNLQNNASNQIYSRWSQWTTTNAFSLNPAHRRTLAMPVARDDAYTSGAALTVSSPGVLGNDTHLNLGGAGIQLQAVKISNPANGSVTLNADGSFTYTANPGFSGLDSFRYKVWDGRLDSTRNATVTIQVTNQPPGFGPATRLIWTTPPAGATNGLPFAQQPWLQTADESGTPTTNGLPATLPVTVTLNGGAETLAGTTNIDLGTGASNGSYQFADLQINAVGSDFTLTAGTVAQTNISENLLLNGDFNSPASTAAPDHWTPWSFGNGWANHENKPEVTLDGSYYLVAGGFENAGGGFFQMVAATAGRTYTLSVQSGADTWWLPYGEMRLIFLDAATNQLAVFARGTVDPAGYGQNYDIPHPWASYTLSALAPAGTAFVKVEFAAPTGTGSVWFEQAVLREQTVSPVLTAVTTPPFPVYAPQNRTNYIAGIAMNPSGSITLQFIGSPGVAYYIQTTTNLTPPIIWSPALGSTNVVTNTTGLWSYDVTNLLPQQYFRTHVMNP